MTTQDRFGHEPVMVDEVVESFRPIPAGVFVDATVGGGGHADAVLSARSDLTLVGVDRDDAALEAAARRLAPHRNRVTLRRARFDQIDRTLDDLGHRAIVGILFDLGVSSAQLDQSERGFSYRHDGPLDMRMDRRSAVSADDLVNRGNEAELRSIIRRYGDERFARRIAQAIVAARPIEGTLQLAEVVRSAIPAAARRRGGHPAKRTFQALRIAVNDELAVLVPALEQAITRLERRGRGAVLAYHSGEDRIVKHTVNDAVHAGRQPRHLPTVDVAEGTVRWVFSGARTPSEAEVSANPRAASARLRVFEKLADAGTWS